MKGARAIRSAAVAALLLLLPLPAAPAEAEPGNNPLLVDPAGLDFTDHQELFQRLRSDPHYYFRFINVPFSQEVCRRFAPRLEGTPSFNLHGDAHLEQYAITDVGRGLTDFDDSSTGPAVIDLVRLGVSLHLACRAQGCGDRVNELVELFLTGYRFGLEEPQGEAPVPRIVERVRAGFEEDRRSYLAWVDSAMAPVPESEAKELASAMEPYVEAMLQDHPELDADYFELVAVGYLRLGVGSAMDRKYLVRIRGSSAVPEDDLVLEVKEVSDLSGIDCVTLSQATDPFRILVGQARIAYEPYRLAGYLRLRGRPFWVHAWVDNYRELDVREDYHSLQELQEVLFDAGVQLGQGHTRQIASPLDEQLRREQLRLLNQEREAILATCRELAEQTVSAWERFRSLTVAPPASN